MTTHFDLHSTTIAQGVGAKPNPATVKRSMRWLVPAGLLAVGAVAIAATIGNDDGATTVRSLTPAAPAAEVSTGGGVSLRDAVAGVPDGGLDLGVISPGVGAAAEVSTDGAVSLRDAVAGVPDGGLDLGVVSPGVGAAAEVSTDGAVSLRDAVAGIPDGGLDLGVISPVRSGSITPSCDAGTPC